MEVANREVSNLAFVLAAIVAYTPPALQAFDAVVDLDTLDGANGFVNEGNDEGSFFGNSVSSTGDINNDGIDDIAVGAANSKTITDGMTFQTGKVYVFYGKRTGHSAIVDSSSVSAIDGFVVSGTPTINSSGRLRGTDFGLSIDTSGDINADGFDDLVVGAPSGYELRTGETFVIFGSAFRPIPNLSVRDLDGFNGFSIEGEGRSFSGISVSIAGDLNNDGIDGVLIGAFRASSLVGKLYVV